MTGTLAGTNLSDLFRRMTWDLAIELVSRELHRLMERRAEWIGAEDLLPDDESGESVLRDLHHLDLDTREVLDAAVRQFATTGEWPELSMECRYVLSRRLFCALDLLNTLALPTGKPVVAEPSARESEIVEWLLNVTWRSRADRWLIATGSRHLHSPVESPAAAWDPLAQAMRPVSGPTAQEP